jgi:hypothetical protein
LYILALSRVFLITGNRRRAHYHPEHGGTAMTSSESCLQEAYRSLASILQRPAAFGLGTRVPPALEDSLVGTLQLLGQAMNEQEYPIPEEDQEELSQDADQVVSAAS